MYFDAPEEGAPEPRSNDGALRAAFSINALALLVLGFAWNPIMAWCQQAFI